jgi:hypothetical protein
LNGVPAGSSRIVFSSTYSQPLAGISVGASSSRARTVRRAFAASSVAAGYASW